MDVTTEIRREGNRWESETHCASMLHSDGDKDRIKNLLCKQGIAGTMIQCLFFLLFVCLFFFFKWEIITLFGMDTTVFSFSAHVKVLHKSQKTQLKSMLKLFYSINFQDLGGMS